MNAIEDDAAANAAIQNADTLIEDVVGGSVRYEREAAVLGEATALLEAALTHYRNAGNLHKTAEILESFGYMARHAQDDAARAGAYFRESADLFHRVGDTANRLSVMMELGEIDASDPSAQAAAIAAVEAGLPDDLHHSEDPKRLALAKAEADDTDGALSLYDMILEEALRRGANARAAMILRDMARVHEDGKKDRVRATEALEHALACAEQAQDKEEIGASLLRLTDIWVERRKIDRARDYFERVTAMRGLPGWQKKLIHPMRMYFA